MLSGETIYRYFVVGGRGSHHKNPTLVVVLRKKILQSHSPNKPEKNVCVYSSDRINASIKYPSQSHVIQTVM